MHQQCSELTGTSERLVFRFLLVNATEKLHRLSPHMRFARFLVCSLVKKTAYRIAQRISCVHYYHLAVFADPTVLALLCHFCCVHLALFCSPLLSCPNFSVLPSPPPHPPHARPTTLLFI